MSKASQGLTIQISPTKIITVVPLIINIGLAVAGYYYVGKTDNELGQLRTKLEETNTLAMAAQYYFEHEKSKMYKEIKQAKDEAVENISAIATASALLYDDFDKRSKAIVNWGVDFEKRVGEIIKIIDVNANTYNKNKDYVQSQIGSLYNQTQAIQSELVKHRQAILLIGGIRQ